MHKLAYSALIGSLLVLVGANQSALATNYFSWGAETMTPAWGAKGSSTGAASLRGSSSISTVAHTGTKSLKVTPNGSGTNESVGIDLNGTPPTYPFSIINSPSLYYRWWMRIETGFSWGDGSVWGGPNGSKVKSGRLNKPDLTAQFYTGYIFRNGFRIAECEATSGHAGGCLNNDGTTGSDNGPIFIPFDFTKMADGRWHEYIVRVKPNTSTTCTTPGTCNAQFEAYVDGASVGSYNNWRLTQNDGQFIEWWGSWMTNPYFQMGSSVAAGGTIYLDDFSTDDTWNSLFSPSGPGGSVAAQPPPPPTPPPPAPTNLLVK